MIMKLVTQIPKILLYYIPSEIKLITLSFDRKHPKLINNFNNNQFLTLKIYTSPSLNTKENQKCHTKGVIRARRSYPDRWHVLKRAIWRALNPLHRTLRRWWDSARSSLLMDRSVITRLSVTWTMRCPVRWTSRCRLVYWLTDWIFGCEWFKVA